MYGAEQSCGNGPGLLAQLLLVFAWWIEKSVRDRVRKAARQRNALDEGPPDGSDLAADDPLVDLIGAFATVERVIPVHPPPARDCFCQRFAPDCVDEIDVTGHATSIRRTVECVKCDASNDTMIRRYDNIGMTAKKTTDPKKLKWQAEIGERLRDARKARGLTQAEIGALVFVGDDAISAIEKGVNLLQPDIAQKLDQNLGITWSYLYTGRMVDLPPDLQAGVLEQQRLRRLKRA